MQLDPGFSCLPKLKLCFDLYENGALGFQDAGQILTVANHRVGLSVD
jgi:hypothetical protein